MTDVLKPTSVFLSILQILIFRAVARNAQCIMHNAQLMYFPSGNVLKIIDSAGKNDTGQDRMGNDKICTVRALR